VCPVVAPAPLAADGVGFGCAASVLQILDELQDVIAVEHCLDIITWLEQHRALLASPGYKNGQQQV
jgi:hypothetical protein